MRIRWSPLAVARVAEIAAWIAADRPAAAERLVEGLFAAVERLSTFPESGRRVPDSEYADLREIVYRGYRIIYRTAEERIDVLTVRHSLQLLEGQDLGDDPVV